MIKSPTQSEPKALKQQKILLSLQNSQSEREKEIIAGQYSYFDPEDCDSDTKRKNKCNISQLMKKLEKRGILVGETMQDYEVIGEPFEGGGAIVYKTIFKQTAKSVNDNKDCIYKALKRRELQLSKKITFFKEIGILCDLNHKNVVKIEKVFFDYDASTGKHSINLVMPFIKNSFMSWLVNSEDQKTHFFYILKNKRSFEEVRSILCSALMGISHLHENNIIHLDIKFDNLLVEEINVEVAENNKVLDNCLPSSPKSSANSPTFSPSSPAPQRRHSKTTKNGSPSPIDHNFDFEAKIPQSSMKQIIEDQCVVAGLGIGHDISKLKQQLLELPEFLAPEIVDFTDTHQAPSLKKTNSNDFSDGTIFDNSFSSDLENLVDQENEKSSNEIFTTKADIYSYGVMLYRIFVDEIDDVDVERISKREITKRIYEIFPNDKETVSEAIIEDLTSIMSSTLAFDQKKRPTGMELLVEHLFFNNSDNRRKKTKEISKISYYELLEDLFFEKAMHYLHGDADEKKDEKKARKMLEELSEKQNFPAAYFLGYLMWNGIGGKKDVINGEKLCVTSAPQALKYFKHKAKKKQDHNALFAIGDMHCDGHGLIQSYSKAVKYWKLSAELGNNSYSKYSLGCLYAHGLFVEQDYGRAYDFFKSAAENGWMYQHGKFISQNYDIAFEWYSQSSACGDSDGIKNLAWMFMNGLGTPKNAVKAFNLYRQASDLNNGDALFNFGCMFQNGHGTKQDHGKALEYFQAAAEQNNSLSLFNLGLASLTGKGIEKDESKAFSFFKKCAIQSNDADAQCNLGWMLMKGMGCEQDFTQAFHFFLESAEQNNDKSAFQVGLAFMYGKGVKQDFVQAKKYFEIASELGNRFAQNSLAWMLMQKDLQGIQQNTSKALTLFSQSAFQGNPDAKKNMEFAKKEPEINAAISEKETTLFVNSSKLEFYSQGNGFDESVLKMKEMEE